MPVVQFVRATDGLHHYKLNNVAILHERVRYEKPPQFLAARNRLVLIKNAGNLLLDFLVNLTLRINPEPGKPDERPTVRSGHWIACIQPSQSSP